MPRLLDTRDSAQLMHLTAGPVRGLLWGTGLSGPTGAARLRRRCSKFDCTGGLRPGPVAGQAATVVWDRERQCCSTTRCTAAADSANWDNASALLFLNSAG